MDKLQEAAEQPELKVNVWDWIVTKSGEIRQIDSDDMMDLKYEDIQRLANGEEIKTGILRKVRGIADRHADVVEQRKFLDNYTSYDGGKSYSQYTVLKMMKAYKEDVEAQLLQQNKELREALVYARIDLNNGRNKESVISAINNALSKHPNK